MEHISPFEKADMLDAIAKGLGMALWALQDLEWVTVNYLVVTLKVPRGIGIEKGTVIFEKQAKRTFGQIIPDIVKAGFFDADLTTRFDAILEERNWLAHRSKHEHRGVLSSREECTALLSRLDNIKEEAWALQKHVGKLMEDHVTGQGVSKEFIDREAEKLIKQWGIQR